MFLAAWAMALLLQAQGESYQVVSVNDGGTITGSVKWTGPRPPAATFSINKDQQVCDPDGQKTRDLERLVIGPQGGVANTVVYLKHVSSGKAFAFPEVRRSLNQRHCRYEPHILLVPEKEALQLRSSDPVLHTVHMQGAASFNLPFPFVDRVVTHEMSYAGIADVRCNGGHTWMNAELFVAPHPYYAVTDESGNFMLNDVPPGEYELVAWHEGWNLSRSEFAVDVLTQRRIRRPVFSEPRTWERKITVTSGGTATVAFTIGEK
jgi:hypothetical protein